MKRFKFIKDFFPIIIAITGFLVYGGCKDKTETTTETPADSTTLVKTDTTNNMYTDTTTRNYPVRKGRVRIDQPAPIDKSTAMNADSKGYYNYTETMPAYPGGQSSLDDYITSKLEYPQEAIDQGIEGTVTVRFTIDENGRVGNVQTSGSELGYGLEDAARKAVSGMTNWTPGTVNGKKVKAWYSLPLTFKIED